MRSAKRDMSRFEYCKRLAIKECARIAPSLLVAVIKHGCRVAARGKGLLPLAAHRVLYPSLYRDNADANLALPSPQ